MHSRWGRRLVTAHSHPLTCTLSPRTDCSPPGARRWQSTGGKAGGGTDTCQGQPPPCAPGLKCMQISWPWLYSDWARQCWTSSCSHPRAPHKDQDAVVILPNLHNGAGGWEIARLREPLYSSMGFWSSSVGKESACNTGDPGSIPEWGRSPGEGNGNALQRSLATVHGVAQSRTWLRD